MLTKSNVSMSQIGMTMASNIRKLELYIDIYHAWARKSDNKDSERLFEQLWPSVLEIPPEEQKSDGPPPLQHDESKNTFECGSPPKRLIPGRHDTNLKLNYETRFKVPQIPPSPPVGHNVHNTEKLDPSKAHEQISPTSEQSSPSINES
jgi:hypothetical protein